jgi:hypothetical protein
MKHYDTNVVTIQNFIGMSGTICSLRICMSYSFIVLASLTGKTERRYIEFLPELKDGMRLLSFRNMFM